MNLLLLCDRFLPHAGGSRVYYYSLYKHLTAQFDDNVTILTKKVEGWERFDAQANGERFRIIRRFRPLADAKYYRLPQLLLPFADAALFVRSQGVDLVHAGDLFPQGLISMCLKKLLGVPYMVYCHGEEITQTDPRRYQPAVRNLIYNSANGVIAANEFARQGLMRVGVPESNIFKILPGVDSERFSPRPPNPDLVRRYGLQGKTVLLTVGRLVPRKGHSLVLQALARIRDRVPPFHYLIVGEGPERESIRSLATQLRLSGNVTFAGKVPEDQLPDFYNLCDVFVVASRIVDGDLEGFGMVFLEANAAGKPVLGGRTGGTSEAVIENSNGILVDPENIDELAIGLELFLSNADVRHRLGTAGLHRARTEFSWQAQARCLREVCETILERARAAPRSES